MPNHSSRLDIGLPSLSGNLYSLKKDGVDELKKLSSGMKNKGEILTFFYLTLA
jgi:hypothetical protein